MSAKYNFGGISKYLGVFKVRVGQGDMGHTDIDMLEFDKKMTKAEVCQVLIKHERFTKFTKEIQETYDKKTGLAVAKKASPAKSAVAKQEKVAKEKPKKQEKKVSAKKPKLVIQKPAPVDEDDDLEIEELKKLAV